MYLRFVVCKRKELGEGRVVQQIQKENKIERHHWQFPILILLAHSVEVFGCNASMLCASTIP